MMKDLRFLLIVVVAASLASCGSSRKAGKATRPAIDTTKQAVGATQSHHSTSTGIAEEETPGSVLAKLNHIDFTTFSGKAAVDFTDGKSNSRSVTVKLSMKKDELIWLSGGILGFEGVRALITKDSVKIINKLQKEYIATSMSYLQDKLGLPVDFTTLQDLLIGNAIFIDENNASLSKNGVGLVISSQSEGFKNLLSVLLPGYLPSVSNLTDTDASKNRSAALTYADYRSAGGNQFPTRRNIKVNYKNNIEINLAFQSYEFNGAVNTPFSVPSGYKIKK